MPARVKTYAPFTNLQNVIKSYLKYNGIVVDLRSEALRERHWKELKKVRWGFGFAVLCLSDDIAVSHCVWSDVRACLRALCNLCLSVSGSLSLCSLSALSLSPCVSLCVVTEALQRIGASWVFAELTLGNIWDSDLQKHENAFKEIILTAQVPTPPLTDIHTLSLC